MNIIEGLAFDDVLLAPKYSEVSSRSEIDLSIEVSKGFKFNLPFVPSNMKTISELAMVKLMVDNGSLGVFHRFTTIETQLGWLEEAKKWRSDALNYVGFSIGVKPEDYVNAKRLVHSGAKIIVIDIAHGNSKHCLEMTAFIAKTFPDVLLISGNVSDGEGAENLWGAGADIVKVGIGGGSICLTRKNTGNGVPSITSLSDCYDHKRQMESILNRKLFLMQDGGMPSPGCVSKALCFADLCMIGNLFSATDEAPGDILEINNIQYKSYVGSSTHRGAHTEGVEGLKKYKGSASQVIKSISEGIQSCCSYQGVRNLTDLKRNPKFIKMSSAGLQESGAHNMDIIIR